MKHWNSKNQTNSTWCLIYKYVIKCNRVIESRYGLNIVEQKCFIISFGKEIGEKNALSCFSCSCYQITSHRMGHTAWSFGARWYYHMWQDLSLLFLHLSLRGGKIDHFTTTQTIFAPETAAPHLKIVILVWNRTIQSITWVSVRHDESKRSAQRTEVAINALNFTFML